MLLISSSLPKGAPRLGAKHNTIPSRSEYLMMSFSSNRRLSIACSSSHIGAQALMSKIEGSGVALPRKQICMFSLLILPLPLGKSVDRHFYLRLHSGSNFRVCAPGFVTFLEKLCLMSFASRMHLGLYFHLFAVDFVIITEKCSPSKCEAYHHSFTKRITHDDFLQ